MAEEDPPPLIEEEEDPKQHPMTEEEKEKYRRLVEEEIAELSNDSDDSCKMDFSCHDLRTVYLSEAMEDLGNVFGGTIDGVKRKIHPNSVMFATVNSLAAPIVPMGYASGIPGGNPKIYLRQFHRDDFERWFYVVVHGRKIKVCVSRTNRNFCFVNADLVPSDYEIGEKYVDVTKWALRIVSDLRIQDESIDPLGVFSTVYGSCPDSIREHCRQMLEQARIRDDTADCMLEIAARMEAITQAADAEHAELLKRESEKKKKSDALKLLEKEFTSMASASTKREKETGTWKPIDLDEIEQTVERQQSLRSAKKRKV